MEARGELLVLPGRQPPGLYFSNSDMHVKQSEIYLK